MSDYDLDRLRAAYPALRDADPPRVTQERLGAAYERGEPDPTASRPSWLHRTVLRSRGTGLLLIGAVAVSGTAVAATVGGWNPQLGSSNRGERPRASTSAVPAEQLAMLSVLRRSQTDRDRGPIVEQALKRMDRSTVDGVHVDAIRVIHQSPRSATILIPAQRTGPDAPNLPDIRSEDVLCLQTFSYVRPQTFSNGGKTVRFPGGLQGGGTCGTTEALRTTGIRTGIGPGRVNTGPIDYVNGPRTHYATVVPDGVAKVTVNLRGKRQVTVPVRDNVYRFSVPGIASEFGTIWYDADGKRIEHRKRPSANRPAIP